ncbi:unnamed protein product [Durusdinium trenchii]|uniref:Uncharacterized protein n=1 Tax=Durusdinium trenchii TaxID=1381693 RepID=A0ABP0SPZ9_9DINO
MAPTSSLHAERTPPLIAERFAAAYEAQLRQLRRQAEEEQQALQGEMEALKQAAYNAQAAAAQHRAHVHMACQVGPHFLQQDLGLRRQQLAAVTGELRRLRAQSLVEQQRLKEEKAQLQQEQQRLAELRSKVSSEGLQLRHALQDAEQRLQYEEQVQRHLQERLRKALAERDQEFHQVQEHQHREQEAQALRDAAREKLRHQEENTRQILEEAERHLQADVMSPHVQPWS